MAWRIVLGVVIAIALSWIALALSLVLIRPRGSFLLEALRLLPDTLRLLRRLAADRTLPRIVRIRLWMLFGYLAFPLDIIPDFIPIIGYADDVIIVCAVLRSVVRQAGADAVQRHWPGSRDGLAALWRAAGLPGSPDPRQRAANMGDPGR